MQKGSENAIASETSTNLDWTRIGTDSSGMTRIRLDSESVSDQDREPIRIRYNIDRDLDANYDWNHD